MKFFNIGDCKHDLGDRKCSECWKGYPVKCTNCGGLIHAQFTKKDSVSNSIHVLTLCEKCGSDFKLKKQKNKKNFHRY